MSNAQKTLLGWAMLGSYVRGASRFFDELNKGIKEATEANRNFSKAAKLFRRKTGVSVGRSVKDEARRNLKKTLGKMMKHGDIISKPKGK